MILGVEGMSMGAGPKGIDRPGSIGPDVRVKAPPSTRARTSGGNASMDEPDAVVHLSSRAIGLSRGLVAEEVSEDQKLDAIARLLVRDGYLLDARKTAEAILRRAVPELHQALAAAGEVEE
jgi:hypothetical protein